jgi:hypothetical protein
VSIPAHRHQVDLGCERVVPAHDAGPDDLTSVEGHGGRQCARVVDIVQQRLLDAEPLG